MAFESTWRRRGSFAAGAKIAASLDWSFLATHLRPATYYAGASRGDGAYKWGGANQQIELSDAPVDCRGGAPAHWQSTGLNPEGIVWP